MANNLSLLIFLLFSAPNNPNHRHRQAISCQRSSLLQVFASPNTLDASVLAAAANSATTSRTRNPPRAKPEEPPERDADHTFDEMDVKQAAKALLAPLKMQGDLAGDLASQFLHRLNTKRSDKLHQQGIYSDRSTALNKGPLGLPCNPLEQPLLCGNVTDITDRSKAPDELRQERRQRVDTRRNIKDINNNYPDNNHNNNINTMDTHSRHTRVAGRSNGAPPPLALGGPPTPQPDPRTVTLKTRLSDLDSEFFYFQDLGGETPDEKSKSAPETTRDAPPQPAPGRRGSRGALRQKH